MACGVGLAGVFDHNRCRGTHPQSFLRNVSLSWMAPYADNEAPAVHLKVYNVHYGTTSQTYSKRHYVANPD